MRIFSWRRQADEAHLKVSATLVKARETDEMVFDATLRLNATIESLEKTLKEVARDLDSSDGAAS